MQVYRVWEMTSLADNRYMASLLPRATYCTRQKALRTYVTDEMEECNASWAAAWEMWGGGMRRRGPIAPHRGGGMGVGQWIAREPHLADRKFYVRCDIPQVRPRCLPRYGSPWTSTPLWLLQR